MERSVKISFGIHLAILRIFGMLPYQRFKRLYKIYALFIYCVMITPIPLLVALNLFLQENGNLEQISDNAFLGCQMLCLITKLKPFICNTEEIRRSIYMLECPLFVTHASRQEKFINDCVKICKRNCWLFLAFCVFSFVTWAIKPIVRGEKRLPLEIWFPVDFATSPRLYYAMYVYVVLGIKMFK
jgi:hypothetical protein